MGKQSAFAKAVQREVNIQLQRSRGQQGRRRDRICKSRP